MSDYSEIDLAIALQLQAQFEEERRVHLLNSKKLSSSNATDLNKMLTKDGELHEPEQEKLSVSLIDPTWELLDPNPKIHDLFLIFNDQFFWGRLSGIAVSWSPRMTLCAGVCSYERRGGLCSVRLSVPLLKLRPRKDLVETLLHEMIHAYLFVTKNDTDHDGHGPQFHEHMYRINKIAGTKISVYHQFHDEVDVYRQHVWLCNGPCQKRRPYFGLVKRSMNRAPSERDPWWQQHKLSCGGTYTKIKEPEGYGIKSKKIKVSEGAALNSKPVEDIRNFFAHTQDSKSSSVNKENIKKHPGGNINRLDFSTNDATKVVKKIGNVHGIDEGRKLKGKNSSAKKPAVSQKFKTKDPSNESANKQVKGGGQSGLGMRKAGTGSTTVTVGKWRPSAETKAPPTNIASISNFTPFAGQGHSLGGAESNVRVSRLLSLQSQGEQIASTSTVTSSTHKLPSCNSVISPYSSISEDEFTKHQSHGDEDRSSSMVKCPLCRKELSSADFDDHISFCLGDFDECDDDFVSKQSKKTSRSKVSGNEIKIFSSSSFNGKSSSDDDEGSEEAIASELQDSVIIVDDSGSNSFHSASQFEGKLYPCPVCNENFSESTISKHVNKHFS